MSDDYSNNSTGDPAGDDLVADADMRRGINPKSPRQAIQPETGAPPPNRSRYARHPLIVVMNFFMMFCFLAVIGLGAALYFGRLSFDAEGPLTETTSVLISPGASLDSIAGRLERQNVISQKLVFWTGVRLSKAEGKLKAGEYLFEPGVSMREVMDALVSGRSILHAVTIPEGMTSEQAIARLLANDVLTGAISTIPPEGSLLPETYKFTRGMSRQQIIEEMKRAQARAVQEIWERRVPDLPIRTPEEMVTLASIVEKETGKADERPRVASVFINRLRQNMRLQSDPTIIYGIFGGKGKPSDRPIFRSDIEKATPYNTYTIDGLPPGPIANPGRAALEAVANPSRTSDLYFVADGTGGHVFAETLDEHSRNVARWREIERAREAAAEAASGETDETISDGETTGATEGEAANDAGENETGESGAGGDRDGTQDTGSGAGSGGG